MNSQFAYNYFDFGTAGALASSTLGVAGPVIEDFLPWIIVVGGVLLAIIAVSILIRILVKH